MPKPINEPGLAIALIELLSLKGRVEFDLDERVVPTVVVADISKEAVAGVDCMGLVAVAAVAGQNNFMGVNTVAGVDLSVKEIWISMSHATASYDIKLLTTAELATLGITTLQLTSLQSPAPRGAALAGPQPVRSQSFGGTIAGVALGDTIGRIVVEPFIPAIIRIPATIIGANVGAVAGIAVACTLVNVATAATFICEEKSAS